MIISLRGETSWGWNPKLWLYPSMNYLWHTREGGSTIHEILVRAFHRKLESEHPDVPSELSCSPRITFALPVLIVSYASRHQLGLRYARAVCTVFFPYWLKWLKSDAMCFSSAVSFFFFKVAIMLVLREEDHTLRYRPPRIILSQLFLFKSALQTKAWLVSISKEYFLL